jgi:hypothetical protein
MAVPLKTKNIFSMKMIFTCGRKSLMGWLLVHVSMMEVNYKRRLYSLSLLLGIL